ncbi:MAG: M28 family peptidase [Nitrospiria bacterium]
MREIEVADRITRISEARLLDHIKKLVGTRHPTEAPKALDAAADYILGRMRQVGLETIEESFGGEEGDAFVNLIGRQAASCTDKEILVVGAHYDTVCGTDGADDNASGVAVLLEVARILSPMRGRKTLQFVAFSMEEAGFLGSEHFVSEVCREKIPVWGAIVLECVGYIDRRPGSQRTPVGFPFSLPDCGDFIGLAGNEKAVPIKEAFESAALRHGPALPVISLLVPGNGALFPDARRSDHVPFWDQGYRAVMLTDTADFRNPHYHQKSDRLETLDIPFISAVARALTAAVIDLAELGLPRGATQ